MFTGTPQKLIIVKFSDIRVILLWMLTNVAASLIICFPLAFQIAGTVITQSKSAGDKCKHPPFVRWFFNSFFRWHRTNTITCCKSFMMWKLYLHSRLTSRKNRHIMKIYNNNVSTGWRTTNLVEVIAFVLKCLPKKANWSYCNHLTKGGCLEHLSPADFDKIDDYCEQLWKARGKQMMREAATLVSIHKSITRISENFTMINFCGVPVNMD